jgi:periplasmic protein CpxP/Spy
MNKTSITRSLPASPVLSKPARMLLATLGLAVVASFTQTAFAQGMGHRGGMHGGMHGEMGGGMMGGPQMGRMLDLVNATPEQRAQIKTIFEAARADLKGHREAGATLHQQMQAAFAATTVDANVVEALRVKMQAHRDVASKRMSLAMIEASRVLSVDQRKTLADAMAKRQAMMQRHAAERGAMDKPAR